MQTDRSRPVFSCSMITSFLALGVHAISAAMAYRMRDFMLAAVCTSAGSWGSTSSSDLICSVFRSLGAAHYKAFLKILQLCSRY